MKPLDVWLLVIPSLLGLLQLAQGVSKGYITAYNFLCNPLPPTFVAVQWDCSGFVQCVQGADGDYRSVWHECPVGLEYDSTARTCISGRGKCENAATVAQQVCPDHPQLKFPHPESCTLYYDCNQTVATDRLLQYENECAFPELFDADGLTCKLPAEANCEQSPKPLDKCSYRLECEAPNCVGLADGRQPFPGQPFDVEYQTCASENVTGIGRCSAFAQIFDPIQKICTKDYKVSIKLYCEQNPNVKFPSAGSCAQYYDCSKVTHNIQLEPYQNECAYLYLFDSVTKTCAKYSDVMCGTRYIPKAPCNYVIGQCTGRPSCISCEASCTTMADGPALYPGRALTSAYLECQDERTIDIKECLQGQAFDPVIRKCTTEIDTNTLDLFCAKNPTMILPHPGKCAQSYNCMINTKRGNLKKYVEECPYPQLFNPMNNKCESHTNVDCKFREEPKTFCDYLAYQCIGKGCAPCQNTLPHCDGKPDGDRPMELKEMTSDYIICSKGRMLNVGECSYGQLFDMLNTVCTSTIKEAAFISFCTKYKTGHVAVPDHCGQYLDCANYQNKMPDVSECPYPKWYSTSMKTCLDYKQVKCGKRTWKKEPCDYMALNPCTNDPDPNCKCTLPSCISKAEGAITPHPTDNTKYYICRDSRTIMMWCLNSGTFDTTTSKCTAGSIETPTEASTISEASAICQAYSNAKLASKLDCHQYYDCASSTSGSLLHECLYPEEFNTDTMTCDDYKRVNCGNRKEWKAPCEYVQNKLRYCPSQSMCAECENNAPSCSGKPNGFKAIVPANQSNYYVCENERTRLQSCPDGSVYDSFNNICTGEALTALNLVEAEAICASNPNARITHAVMCHAYFNCRATPKLQECGYMELFDSVTMLCKPKSSVQCGSKTIIKTACQYKKVIIRYCGSPAPCVKCEQNVPSCLGKADGFKDVIPVASNKYYTCTGGWTEVFTCPQGQQFDRTTKICQADKLEASTPAEAAAKCASNPTANITHSVNCHQYFDCQASPTLQECTYLTLYDPTTQSCVNRLSVSCGTRVFPKEPCQYARIALTYCGNPTPCTGCTVNQPSCQGKAHGFKDKIPSSNTKYYTCLDGWTVFSECPPGQVFDLVNKNCKVLDLSAPNEIEAKKICKSNPTTKITITDRCHLFFDCQSLEMKTCSYRQLYDPQTASCQPATLALEAKCGSRVVIKSPCDHGNIAVKYCPSVLKCTDCVNRVLLCVGKPSGYKAVDPKDSTNYFECSDEWTIISQCGAAEQFNTATKMCNAVALTASSLSEASGLCLNNNAAKIIDSTACHKYYDCSSSGVKHVTCPYQTVYHAASMTCQSYSTAAGQCGPRVVDKIPCSYPDIIQTVCGSPQVCANCNNLAPSCIGKTDNFKAVVPADNNKYYTCFDGFTRISACPPGQMFDSILMNCKTGILSANTDDAARLICKENPGIKIPHSVHCKSYYDCNKADILQECVYPLLFDAVKQICQETVACGSRKENKAPCEYTVINQAYCTGGESCPACTAEIPSCVLLSDDYMDVMPKDKTGYFVCKRGRTLISSCMMGQVFDTKTKMCKKPDTTHTSFPAVMTSIEADAICKLDHLAVIAKLDNCAQFFDCAKPLSNHGKYLDECTYPDLFNEETRLCDSYTTAGAKCGSRTIPRAPCDYISKNLWCDPGVPCSPCEAVYPSCLSRFEGTMIPDPTDNKKYFLCKDTRTIEKKCAEQQVFDKNLLKCITTKLILTSLEATVACQNDRAAKYGKADNCAQFFDCSLTSSTYGPYIAECPYAKLYNETLKQCMDVTDCGARKEPKQPCDYLGISMQHCTAPSPCSKCIMVNPSCIGKPDNFRDYMPFNTKQYYECKNERTVYGTCDPHIIDPVTKLCQIPGVSSVQEARTLCQQSPKAVFAKSDNCAQYFDCSVTVGIGGSPYLSECPYAQLFDSLSLTCKDFTAVHCNNRWEPKNRCEYYKIACPGGVCVPCNEPRCDLLPDGQHAYPGRELTEHYIVCKGLRLSKTLMCDQNLFFDPRTRKCMGILVKDTADDYCRRYPGKMGYQPQNCAHYLNCTGGVAEMIECGYPSLFDGRDCNDFEKVQCGRRFLPTEPCQYEQNRKCGSNFEFCTPCEDRLPPCTGLSDGIHGHPVRLVSAVSMKCYKGRTLSVVKCKRNVFNPITQTCDVVSPAIIDFVCKNMNLQMSGGIIADPENCARYYNCNKTIPQYLNLPYLSECEYPMFYSLKVKQCILPFDWKDNIFHCEDRLQPEAPCDYLSKCSTPAFCPNCEYEWPSCVGKKVGIYVPNVFIPNLSPRWYFCAFNRTMLTTK